MDRLLTRRRWRLGTVVVFGVGLLIGAGQARADAVALELVLALDSSSSVSRSEFDLQARGLAQAFRHADVTRALQAAGVNGVAVAVVQWSSPGRQRVALPWTRLHNPESAAAFAEKLAVIPRYVASGGTAIGQAMMFARDLLEKNDFSGARKVIDISGDGRANMGRTPRSARQITNAAGITVNGLAIVNEEPRVDRYYAENVIGGDGAFLMTAQDYGDFARAIRRKLVREITGAGIAGKNAPETATQPLQSAGILDIRNASGATDPID